MFQLYKLLGIWNIFMDAITRWYLSGSLECSTVLLCAIERDYRVEIPECAVIDGSRISHWEVKGVAWRSLWLSLFCYEGGTMAILNDKAASSVTGAGLKSGFQSAFVGTNGNVYLINVCSLWGENVLLSHLKMFHRCMLLWQCNEAAVE